MVWINLILFLLNLVVYDSITFHEVFGAIGSPHCAHKEEPILPIVPDHASNYDLAVVLHFVSCGRLLAKDKQNGIIDLTWSDWQWTYIRLQKLDNKAYFWPLNWRDSHGTGHAQSASVWLQASCRFTVPWQISLQLCKRPWLWLFLAQVLHQLELIFLYPQASHLCELRNFD